MNPKTQQILDIFKSHARGYHIVAWDTNSQGNFNLWKLLMLKGFLQSTNLEQAITNWKNIERRGTPTNYKEYPGNEYAPPRRERTNSDWNPYLQVTQFKYYNALAYFLKHNLQNLKVYFLFDAPPIAKSEYLKILALRQFKVYLILGQTPSKDWICLASTVPDQVWNRYQRSYHPDFALLTSCKSTNSDTLDLHDKISKILSKLKPIKVYGYYYGGYNYSYYHQIFCATSSNKFEAIEQVLKVGKTLDDDDYYFNKFYKGSSPFQNLMSEHLQQRKRYLLCLWDVGYAYDLGRTSCGDWVGIRYRSEFEYNP